LSRPFLSLGSINADFHFEVSQDLSGGGTLPARSFVQRAGGKGANRAYFAHRLGISATLLGRVGKDHFATQALEPLQLLGLDLSDVSASATAPTGVSMIAVPEDGEKTILLASNANQEWDGPSLDSLRNVVNDAASEAVLTIDFEVSREAVEVALNAAGERQLRVIADGSFGQEVRPEDLARIYALAPNMMEAGVIAEMEMETDADAERAARKLHEYGVEIVWVKLSDGGCLIATGKGSTRIVAPSVDVVDKTGAGDAFTAAAAIAILEGRTLNEAAIFGVAASSLAVTTKGSQEAYPDRQEFDVMVERVLEHGDNNR
jgi:ribokinase